MLIHPTVVIEKKQQKQKDCVEFLHVLFVVVKEEVRSLLEELVVHIEVDDVRVEGVLRIDGEGGVLLDSSLGAVFDDVVPVDVDQVEEIGSAGDEHFVCLVVLEVEFDEVEGAVLEQLVVVEGHYFTSLVLNRKGHRVPRLFMCQHQEHTVEVGIIEVVVRGDELENQFVYLFELQSFLPLHLVDRSSFLLDQNELIGIDVHFHVETIQDVLVDITFGDDFPFLEDDSQEEDSRRNQYEVLFGIELFVFHDYLLANEGVLQNNLVAFLEEELLELEDVVLGGQLAFDNQQFLGKQLDVAIKRGLVLLIVALELGDFV